MLFSFSFSTKIWQYNLLVFLFSSQWALTLLGITVNEELNSSIASKTSMKRPVSLKDLIENLESIKKSLHYVSQYKITISKS